MWTGCSPAATAPATSYRRLSPTCRTFGPDGTLRALGVPPGQTVLHVGDSLRYDVAGALAAGLQPVHLDPHGLCPAPDGHRHVRTLTELARDL